VYFCPGDKTLTTTGTRVNDDATILYRAAKHDCSGCVLKSRCCPNTPTRKVPRSIHEGARDMARTIAKSWEGRTPHDCARKLRYCSRISSVSSSSTASGYEAPPARAMSSFSQPLPRTSASWQS
jgi:hypothetical protein